MTRSSNAAINCSLVALLSLLGTASIAQVYQTTDENGNPIFSDKPSAAATEVELQQTNTAKSVDVPPPRQHEPEPTRPEPKEHASEPQQTEQVERYMVNERDDDRVVRENLRPRPENPVVKPPVNRPARPSKGR